MSVVTSAIQIPLGLLLYLLFFGAILATAWLYYPKG